MNEECLKCGRVHNLFTGQREREREVEIGREGERKREGERERMAGALAPFSYLVLI